MSQSLRRTTVVVLSFFCIAVSIATAQILEVSETVSGTIFRYPGSYITVDQYMLEIVTTTARVEFDVLSMETTNNRTFIDVNRDCDSAFIDSKIYLYRKDLSTNTLVLMAVNDDEGDDNSAYYGMGRRDGSLNHQDSYMVRTLRAGSYMLAVGRFPLSSPSARLGRSMELVDSFSPYSCQMRKASYGNYQLTIRVQSTSATGIIKKYPNSYVGNIGIRCKPVRVQASRQLSKCNHVRVPVR